MLNLISDNVEKIFSPVVEQIKDLISDQESGAKKAGFPPKVSFDKDFPRFAVNISWLMLGYNSCGWAWQLRICL